MNDKIYFHFLSFKNAIDDLEKGDMRVSLINKLNDPFELKPYLRYPKDKRAPYNRLRGNISKKYGLLCFSGKWEEPLLWGHYAEKHTGISLGFQINLPQERIIQVEYCDKRIEYKLTEDINYNEEVFLSCVGKRKYIRWNYEDEYRIWVKLNKCRKENGNYFLSFGHTLILKEILLGCMLDRSYYKCIIDYANKYNAKIIPLREEWSGYRMRECGTNMKKIKQIQQNID